MPIVAYAFHEQLAMERLNSYFAADEAANSETRPTYCPKCSLRFGLLLVNRADDKNPGYIEDLRTQIGEDCINTLHRDEYTLILGPSTERCTTGGSACVRVDY
jgi:hypothetical protein